VIRFLLHQAVLPLHHCFHLTRCRYRCHHWRHPRTGRPHQFVNTAVPLRRSRWWIFLPMRRKSFPTLRGTQSSPEDSSAISTVNFLGRLATTTLSSSMTLITKRRCARRSPPTPKMLYLLLATPQPHPSLLSTPMMCSMGYKMIVVTVETRPIVIRPPRQEGYLQEAGVEEFKTDNGIVLLATHILL
jgi:hypothetical protein